ncbi:hypothetical protein COV19_01265 [Candidatus Woesearchaeota archaeon CG10_big_fil_rev_8_21_14_0_10_44_13]|nr:MAG: hypothetical protein COV19_01265 [Candidatus Woesearchaeota archaeon CG10_big_fil_rev_8_21_14_0_10_44_13]
MATTEDINALNRIKQHMLNERDTVFFNIRPIAEQFGLDLDSIMEDVIEICGTKQYKVGWHMNCTRANVIPKYEQTNELSLDIDHLQGIKDILKVDMGLISDY